MEKITRTLEQLICQIITQFKVANESLSHLSFASVSSSEFHIPLKTISKIP